MTPSSGLNASSPALNAWLQLGYPTPADLELEFSALTPTMEHCMRSQPNSTVHLCPAWLHLSEELMYTKLRHSVTEPLDPKPPDETTAPHPSANASNTPGAAEGRNSPNPMAVLPLPNFTAPEIEDDQDFSILGRWLIDVRMNDRRHELSLERRVEVEPLAINSLLPVS